MTRIVDSLTDIAVGYDALFCDLWGCLHDGLRPHDAAVAALDRFRQDGGKVVLVTNAPRPRAEVAQQLQRIGVPDTCWDTIATSGDSARAAMFRGAVGRRVFHIGPESDLGFFEPLRLVRSAAPIERVPLEDADGIVCTGPFDAQAEPAVLRDDLLRARDRNLKLLCANPDIVVDRGSVREWCAGAVAEFYEEIGGTSLYFGKPHPPIYDLARERLAESGGDPDGRILAIGDGIATDVAGALGQGLDAVYITGGLDAERTRTSHGPDAEALRHVLAGANLTPAYAMGFLR